MSATSCEVAIIGAGPFGLAAAAHLREAGIETRVFGELMGFWHRQTPRGMLLVSSWQASHIAHPHGALTLDRYQAEQDVELARPIPRDDFIQYGCWFGRRVVPDLDQRQVTRLEARNGGFRLELEDGGLLRADRVVVATGLAPFAYRPALFAALPAKLVSHTADHNDLTGFAGRRVLVVGAGQSALTSAALLHEAGVEVAVVARGAEVRWVKRKLYQHRALEPLRRLLYAPTDVGPAGLSRIVGLPGLFRRLPDGLRERIATRATRPSGATWLRHRVEGVSITTGRAITAATPDGEQLRITLDDGSERTVDHALLATGYRADVTRNAFLAPDLARALRCAGGHPVLDSGFESSVPGLHFVGAAAAGTFGPVMRFVSGTGYTARALTRRVVGQRAAPAGIPQAVPARAGLEAD